jgi:signal transduction histidine kinase
MRERVREQGGQFDIQSDRNGTTITVVMPTAPAESAPPLTAPLPAD